MIYFVTLISLFYRSYWPPICQVYWKNSRTAIICWTRSWRDWTLTWRRNVSSSHDSFSSPTMRCWKFCPRRRTHYECSRTWKSALKALPNWSLTVNWIFMPCLAVKERKLRWLRQFLRRRPEELWRNGCYKYRTSCWCRLKMFVLIPWR